MTAAASPLFQPLSVGAVAAPNRVFMAPLTRNRARPDGTPGDLAPLYYAQRASAGLIVTEATQISAMGQGYVATPGLYADSHLEGWRKVTDAVHAAGGRIFVQAWHVGRISHVSLLPGGARPVAPSAVRADAQTFTAQGPTPVSEPRALETSEIPALIADYARAARNARAAGFDGVEVHGANGYLLDQFLQSRSNRRTDAYGGSAGNRARLLREVLEAVAAEIGADRTGVRLSPTGTFNDMGDATPYETFATAYRALDALGLAYLHVVEQFPGSARGEAERGLLEELRGLWSGVYVANGEAAADHAAAWIASGRAHAVAWGRAFLANPDLPTRLLRGAPLNEADQATFYGGGAEGYVDYPFLDRAS